MRLEDVDNELATAGVPYRYRPLNCFKRLYGAVPDGPRRQELFDPIIEWYLKKYGDAVRWDGVIARFPILIRDVVYLGRASFVREGEVLANVEDEIEDLPNSIAASLASEERRQIMEKLAFGSRYFKGIHNLQVDDAFLGETERSLVRRALYDLENTAITLKHTGDTQSGIVLAHEAAEKYLKAALRKAGSSKNLKSIGHDVPKLFMELLQIESRYSCLSLPVANLQKLSPSMELRYSDVPRSMQMAIEGYYGALYVCGTIAQMWLFDHARGTDKSNFRECSFYIDGAGAAYYCKKVTADNATLTCFRSSKFMGSLLADVKLDISHSALYLEVIDTAQDARLRHQLVAHLRNPGKKMRSEEIGLKRVHGPEGSYSTVLISTSVTKPYKYK